MTGAAAPHKPDRGWLAGVAIVLIYLGALNALAAMSVTTCSNGDASSLWGGFISVGLYGLGLVGLMIAPPRRLVFATLIPAVIAIALHSGFSIRLLVAYVHGGSACGVMMGAPGYSLDGDESLFAILWPAMSVAVWVGLAMAYWRSKARQTKR